MDIIKCTLIFLFTVYVTFDCESGPLAAGKSDSIFAFTGVNVVPMDSERILKSQTVITKGDRIVNIGLTDTTNIPANAIRIDSRGKYLMPGLADMHVHSWGVNFPLFIAYGITTLRIMRGSSFHLELREKVNRDELLGPSLYLCGPFIDGPPPDSADYPVIVNPEAAVNEVKRQKAAGYDYIKILSQLSPEVFDAIMATAGEFNIPVIGHPPYQVEFEKVFTSGMCSIEHLHGYDFALMHDGAPEPDKFERASWLRAWQYFDSSKLPALVEKTFMKGIWNCPTLVCYFNGRIRPFELEEKLNNPILRYVNPVIIEYWTEREYIDEEALITRATDCFRKKTVKALHDSGCRLLLGTDTYQYFTMAGVSVHEELQHLVGAGLTPFEAIKTGTVNAAEFFKAGEEFGKVVIGQRADLILLHNNPLEDIRNTTQIAGVMLRGRWFSETDLKKLLENLAESYGK